jgi:hypothetical protein
MASRNEVCVYVAQKFVSGLTEALQNSSANKEAKITFSSATTVDEALNKRGTVVLFAFQATERSLETARDGRWDDWLRFQNSDAATRVVPLAVRFRNGDSSGERQPIDGQTKAIKLYSKPTFDNTGKANFEDWSVENNDNMREMFAVLVRHMNALRK